MKVSEASERLLKDMYHRITRVSESFEKGDYWDAFETAKGLLRAHSDLKEKNFFSSLDSLISLGDEVDSDFTLDLFLEFDSCRMNLSEDIFSLIKQILNLQEDMVSNYDQESMEQTRASVTYELDKLIPNIKKINLIYFRDIKKAPRKEYGMFL